MPSETKSGVADAEAVTFRDRGYKMAEAGDFTSALLLFRKALELDVDSAVLRELCAQCLMEMERWDEAYNEASEAHSLDPSWRDGAITLARAARNAGYLQESLKAFRMAVSLETTGGDEDLNQELSEIEALWRRDMALRVGIMGLEVHEEWAPSSNIRSCSCGNSGDEDGQGPGGVVWDCGIALAQSISRGWPVELRGKRVLELGAGTGIAGIAAAARGATVVLTDLPSRLPLLKMNAERNRGIVASNQGCMTVAALDWAREQEPLGNDESPQPETSAGEASDERTAQLQESDDPLKGTWDFIIGADLVYARSAVEPLAKVLKDIYRKSPRAALIMAHKSRSDDLDALVMTHIRAGSGQELQRCAWPCAMEGEWGKTSVSVYSSCSGGLDCGDAAES